MTIPQGAEATSDPVGLRFKPFDQLAVSVYVPGVINAVTRHIDSRQTSFMSPAGVGDASSDRTGSTFTSGADGWLLVNAIEVSTRLPIGAVVAFGDSVTDGHGSPTDAEKRYPDFLARRLLHRYGKASPSVLNAGITGNGLFQPSEASFGPTGRVRLRQDVIDQAGATDVIVLEGANDLDPCIRRE